jgi:hypothetical protein
MLSLLHAWIDELTSPPVLPEAKSGFLSSISSALL